MIPGRLTALRPVEPSDLGLLQRITNDVSIQGSVVGWDFPVAEHGQSGWLASSQSNPRTQRLMIQTLDDSTAIGVTGLWEIDWHNRSALTATKIATDWHGRGMGSDAIMTTMAWSFYVVGLRRLHSTILAFNQASIGSYVDRCGWRIEGRHREAVFRKGQWCDLYSVAALRADFDRHEMASDYVDSVAPIDVHAVTRGDALGS